MIVVNHSIQIPEREVALRFIQAAGPGGQNVNKVATAVELRFDVRRSPALPEPVRERLLRQAGRRINEAGELIIQARRHRSQERNRQEAVERLITLVRQAATPPRPRRPTRPSAAARARRLEAKKHRTRIKHQRRSPADD